MMQADIASIEQLEAASYNPRASDDEALDGLCH